MTTKGKNKGGRPRKEIDMALLTKLCQIQCTAVECAGVLGMCADTLDIRLNEETGEGFQEFLKRHSGEGKVSLRREQFKLAMKGNAVMLIWLGKQWLGQTDRQSVTLGGPDDGPIKMNVTYRMAKARK